MRARPVLRAAANLLLRRCTESHGGARIVQAIFASETDLSLGWSVLALLAVPALVLLNGLFVAAEFALVSLRRTRIEELVHRGVKGAVTVEAAVSRLDRTIA